MPEAAPDEAVVRAALEVRAQAHAPYSGFRVGAALEDDTGRLHLGCNVENASYSLTICAERAAVFNAIPQGARRFRRIAVAAETDAGALAAPCGACLQVLREICGDIEVILCNPGGRWETLRLPDLLPRPFRGPSAS